MLITVLKKYKTMIENKKSYFLLLYVEILHSNSTTYNKYYRTLIPYKHNSEYRSPYARKGGTLPTHDTLSFGHNDFIAN